MDIGKLINLLKEQNCMLLETIKRLQILPVGHELSLLALQLYLGKIDININDRPIDNLTEVKYEK